MKIIVGWHTAEKTRRFVCNVTGDTAAEMEQQALATAKACFEPGTRLAVVRDYHVKKNYDRSSQCMYLAVITVAEVLK